MGVVIRGGARSPPRPAQAAVPLRPAPCGRPQPARGARRGWAGRAGGGGGGRGAIWGGPRQREALLHRRPRGRGARARPPHPPTPVSLPPFMLPAAGVEEPAPRATAGRSASPRAASRRSARGGGPEGPRFEGECVSLFGHAHRWAGPWTCFSKRMWRRKAGRGSGGGRGASRARRQPAKRRAAGAARPPRPAMRAARTPSRALRACVAHLEWESAARREGRGSGRTHGKRKNGVKLVPLLASASPFFFRGPRPATAPVHNAGRGLDGNPPKDTHLACCYKGEQCREGGPVLGPRKKQRAAQRGPVSATHARGPGFTPPPPPPAPAR